ncbi:tail fiber domain-containing protein [Gilvimarinus sp. SDUM040013]|uniref:Tail fiber domain-containing protein n=1 Tax=Gilvimarinus gilvus TaxID=3058038 RepID=A0ABU4RVY2_9GAMM|nr:tail fiber domain-containing protein [Gilvimarinus sp. SDUM040013]MDO3387342.1 tail fiber domain-containing protein [Gilvimarinus sp. SDUM040013]MDX6849031.1 tail fiber domain-containing protein [Gilvimarinus sp. SDUM040013]
MRTKPTYLLISVLAAGLLGTVLAPHSAIGQEDAVVVTESGVGMGTATPETPLHVHTSAAADTNMLLLSNDGGSRIYFRNRTAPESGNDSRSWVFATTEPGFRVSRTFSGQTEMELGNAGNLSISGTLSQGSSRAIKHDIQPLSGEWVLSNLSKLEINEWRYDEAPDQRHVGPMSEDFFDAFGLGPDNKHIAPGDMAGLSLAAVKALHDENKRLEERLERLEQALLQSGSL